MRWVEETDLQAHIEKNFELVEGGRPERPPIVATPYRWRDPSTLPTRQFLYGRHYTRRFLSGTVGPGGFGKSTHEMVEAVAMASGKPLLGVKLKAPLRVWYWNGEDPFDELERKVAAICLHYGVTEEDLGGRLFLNSGRDTEIVIAEETRDGATIAQPVLDQLEATILSHGIDVFQFDPFVSCHAVSENDNNKIGRIMKELALLADRTNAAGDLVHHVKKSRASSTEVSVDDGRGASAFIDRVRSARSLSRMSEDEADQMGIDRNDAFAYFRLDHGKANLGPPARQATWRRIISVDLGNGVDGAPGDRVGVVCTWDAPGVFDGVQPEHLIKVQQEVAKGEWREHVQSTAWVGKAVARALDWDVNDVSVKSRIKSMLSTWIKTGVLETYDAPDKNREIRTFVRVGKPVSL